MFRQIYYRVGKRIILLIFYLNFTICKKNQNFINMKTKSINIIGLNILELV